MTKASDQFIKFQKITKLINQFEKIVILGHINPDGDCVGAQQALFLAIKKRYPQKKVFAPLVPSAQFQFLLPSSYDPQIEKDWSQMKDSLFLLVDFASKERLPTALNQANNTVVAIDHHPLLSSSLLDFGWIDPQAPATCQMIYLFLKTMNYPLTKAIATALLTGMITDTGNFTYPNVTTTSYQIAGQLLALGASPGLIHSHLNKENYFDLKIKGFILSSFQKVDKIAYCFVRPEDCQAFPWLKTNQEVKKFIYLFGTLKDVEIWCLIVQVNSQEAIKGSLRSKKKAINQLANRYGGGGHQFAAGFTLQNWEQANQLLTELIHLDKL